MNLKINVSAGAVEYVMVDVTEVEGKDISSDTVQLSLGAFNAPGDWITPDLLEHTSSSSVRVGIIVGDTYTPDVGEYSVWVKIDDVPEIVMYRINDGVVAIA